MPDSTEKEQLRAIAKSVAAAQGNIFIRELLRKKKIRIGTTKAEFLANMLAAIDAATITLADVREWLDEVEGWGDQHIYLYRVPKQVSKESRWGSVAQVKASLPRRLRELWDSQNALEFPEKRTLTGIYYEPLALRFEWHEGVGDWVRAKDKDPEPQEIDGDLYEFRAFRQRQDRKVTRFVLRLDIGLAGLFAQSEWDEDVHDTMKKDIWDVVGPVVGDSKCPRISISKTIKSLDQIELKAKAPKIRSQMTRLADAGAYVEFGGNRAFKDSTLIRSVRNAATPAIKRFRGVAGTFLFDGVTPTGQKRTIKVDLYGEQERARIHAQMKATEVWEVVKALAEAEALDGA